MPEKDSIRLVTLVTCCCSRSRSISFCWDWMRSSICWSCAAWDWSRAAIALSCDILACICSIIWFSCSLFMVQFLRVKVAAKVLLFFDMCKCAPDRPLVRPLKSWKRSLGCKLLIFRLIAFLVQKVAFFVKKWRFFCPLLMRPERVFFSKYRFSLKNEDFWKFFVSRKDNLLNYVVISLSFPLQNRLILRKYLPKLAYFKKK